MKLTAAEGNIKKKYGQKNSLQCIQAIFHLLVQSHFPENLQFARQE